MAARDALEDFVADGLRRGLTRASLGEALSKAGWSDEQVRRALAGYADIDFPIPVPRPRPYLSAHEAFMYVVLFTTLYITCYQLGSLLFDLINLALPDAADPGTGEYRRQAIRWSVSSLIVAFPIFAYMTWSTARMLRRDPTKRASRIRRNLTYFTLFIAACALIGDVTALVYNFLGGELTLRFVLKVMVAGVIAGAVFGYYLSGIRAEEREPAP
jgi:hypothetical protein